MDTEEVVGYGILSAIIVTIIVLAVLVIKSNHEDSRNWEIYSKQHHCTIVGKKQGQIGTGITANGKFAVTTTDDQDIWNCDGGEIQIRNR